MQLSNEEKETLISFDETPADAVIFTYNKAWQKQIEQKLGIKPTMNNGYGGKEYHIPKKRIRMPQPARILSPEQREKLAKRLAQHRNQKSIIRSKNTTGLSVSQAKTISEGNSTAGRRKAGG